MRVQFFIRFGEYSLGYHERDARHCVIGRSESDLVLNDNFCSKAHALLFCTNGVLHIKDLGSRNGVFCNGQRITRSALRVGDQVRLGQTILTITEIESVDATAAPRSEETAIVRRWPELAQCIPQDARRRNRLPPPLPKPPTARASTTDSRAV